MEKQRFAYFDQMKGLAIILVVIGHMMLFAFKFNPSEPSKFIYFNMPMFFYISGYLAYKQIATVRDLYSKLLKRGLTLLVPYVVFLSIMCIFSKYANILEIMFGGGREYWFLYTLFIISSFFLIYEYFVGHVKNTWMYIMLWIIPYLTLIA